MRSPGLLLAAALVLAAVAGPATAQRTTEDHPFETPGRWTPYETRGLTFQAAADATYSAADARSGTSSIQVRFSNAQGLGQDYGAVGVERVVALEEVDDLAFSYKVTAYDHDGRSHREKLKAGVALEPLGPDGEVLDRAAYWVAAWHGSDDTRTPNHDGAVVVSTNPELDTWHRVEADPVADTPVDWSGAHGVRVTVFAAATWAAGDTFSMHVDDLRVGGPASDDPAPAHRVGGDAVGVTAGVEAVETPGIEPATASTPAVDAPATCTLDPCEETTSVATSSVTVDRACVPLAACVGPVEVGSQEATAPAVCSEADAACREEQQVVDSQEASTPAVDATEVLPGTAVDATLEVPAAEVGQPPVMGEAVDPVTVSPDAPVVGPVDVTLCPFRCPVPGAPNAGADLALGAEAHVQAAGEEVHVATPTLP